MLLPQLDPHSFWHCFEILPEPFINKKKMMRLLKLQDIPEFYLTFMLFIYHLIGHCYIPHILDQSTTNTEEFGPDNQWQGHECKFLDVLHGWLKTYRKYVQSFNLLSSQIGLLALGGLLASQSRYSTGPCFYRMTVYWWTFLFLKGSTNVWFSLSRLRIMTYMLIANFKRFPGLKLRGFSQGWHIVMTSVGSKVCFFKACFFIF